MHVASIQTFPSWYASLNRPPKELVQRYEYLSYVALGLRISGIGAGGSAAAAGVAEGIKKGTVRDGIERAVRRFLGQGAILEEAMKRWGSRFVWLSGPVGIAIVAAGSIAYVLAVEQMEEIRAIILHRFQNREVSDEDYRRVFSEIDPNRIVRYDER